MKRDSNEFLKGASFLITGGTGSFGSTVTRYLLDTEVREVRILSRDEKKQDDLRRELNDSRVRFYLGDVRDISSLHGACRNVDYAFHAAALKQVPSCEFFPHEAIMTNSLGSANFISACEMAGVKRAVLLSTDKAVYPINVMGATKLLSERLAISRARVCESSTCFMVTRYGNVMASRGSVIPLFISKMTAGEPVTMTNPAMTRFLMSLSDSVDLVMHALRQGEKGDLFVKRAPASTILDLAAALAILTGTRLDVTDIGTRHGEKLHETLVSGEEMVFAKDEGEFFRVPVDSRDLNYSRYTDHGSQISTSQGYNSENTDRLSIDELVTYLGNNREIRLLLNGTK